MKELGLAHMLAEKRREKGVTQEKLAELTGLSNPHISNVETGSTQVSLKSLIAIANALEITPDVLLCDNIRYGKHIFKNAVMEAVDDCDEVEIRIMADMVQFHIVYTTSSAYYLLDYCNLCISIL